MSKVFNCDYNDRCGDIPREINKALKIMCDGCRSNYIKMCFPRLCLRCIFAINSATCTDSNSCVDTKSTQLDNGNKCIIHGCGIDNCDKFVLHYSDFCKDHSCKSSWCENPTYNDYCSDHECKYDNCFNQMITSYGYCKRHTCKIYKCKSKVCNEDVEVCEKHSCRADGCYLVSTDIQRKNPYCVMHECAVEGCINMMTSNEYNVCAKHICKICNINKVTNTCECIGHSNLSNHKCSDQYTICDICNSCNCIIGVMGIYKKNIIGGVLSDACIACMCVKCKQKKGYSMVPYYYSNMDGIDMEMMSLLAGSIIRLCDDCNTNSELVKLDDLIN